MRYGLLIRRILRSWATPEKTEFSTVRPDFVPLRGGKADDRAPGHADRFDNNELSTKRENCDERKDAAAKQEPRRWRLSGCTQRTGLHSMARHGERYGIARRKAVFNGIV